MKQCGVYMIENTINGRFYIGATVKDFAARWIEHRSVLRRGKHRNHLLQSDWQAYRESAFRFTVLEILPQEMVMEREQQLINELYDRGVSCYNLSTKAVSGGGRKHNVTSPQVHKNKIQGNRLQVNVDFRKHPDVFHALMDLAKTLGVSISKVIRDLIQEKAEEHGHL
jgi:group I intron endonuclease